jgi:hypothetical protein
MIEHNFLKTLKQTAKEQSFLGQEKFVPDFLSDLANFVAIHLWQSLLLLSFLSVILLNIFCGLIKNSWC